MLATSLVFAAYHRVLAPAFLGSILFVCLLRRTGTLWAPILCHCVSNLLLWYPLAGQWIAPAGLGTAAAQLSTWSAHIALLGVTIVLLGSYVWMSRDAAPPLLPKQFDDHAPLPR